MDDVLRKTCEDFIENRDLLRENFKNDGMAMHMMGAALLSSSDEEADADRLLECERILKKCEGFFSPFRGVLKLPVIINMGRKDDPEEYLRLVRKAYDLICADRGSRDERYYLPAMAIASEADSEEDLADLISSSDELFAEKRDLDDLLETAGMSEEDIETEVHEAGEYLKGQKGFGFMGAGSAMREMYAKMLVCIAQGQKTYAADVTSESALDDAIINRYRAADAVQKQMVPDRQILLQTQLMQAVQTNTINMI